MRARLERNSIALLSNWDRNVLDPPSPEWLGHLTTSEKVRRSGLWNSNHVEEMYDPKFLNEIEVRVKTGKLGHIGELAVGDIRSKSRR